MQLHSRGLAALLLVWSNMSASWAALYQVNTVCCVPVALAHDHCLCVLHCRPCKLTCQACMCQ